MRLKKLRITIEPSLAERIRVHKPERQTVKAFCGDLLEVGLRTFPSLESYTLLGLRELKNLVDSAIEDRSRPPDLGEVQS